MATNLKPGRLKPANKPTSDLPFKKNLRSQGPTKRSGAGDPGYSKGHGSGGGGKQVQGKGTYDRKSPGYTALNKTSGASKLGKYAGSQWTP
jgi:hypothetical protein